MNFNIFSNKPNHLRSRQINFTGDNIFSSIKPAPQYSAVISTTSSVFVEKSKINQTAEFQICKESFFTVSVVIYYRKNYFLIESINNVMNKLVSAGLVEYWHRKFVNEDYSKLRRNENRSAMTFDHLKGIIQLWAFCCCCSIICFFCEKIVHKCSRRIA